MNAMWIVDLYSVYEGEMCVGVLWGFVSSKAYIYIHLYPWGDVCREDPVLVLSGWNHSIAFL